MKNKGFTLIELLVVIIIVGILAALGTTQYQKVVERSRSREGVAVLNAYRGAQLRYAVEKGTTTTNIGDLDVINTSLRYFGGPQLSGGVDPTDTNNDGQTIVSIKKNTGLIYNLSITVNGTITCADNGNCTKAGF